MTRNTTGPAGTSVEGNGTGVEVYSACWGLLIVLPERTDQSPTRKSPPKRGSEEEQDEHDLLLQPVLPKTPINMQKTIPKAQGRCAWHQ